MVRFFEEVAGRWSQELADGLVRFALAAVPQRVGGAVEPFDRRTGDELVDFVGPCSFELHAEYEELRYGTPDAGLTVRHVREYVAMGEPHWRERSVELRSHGWSRGARFEVVAKWELNVFWVLPADEHEALLTAWRAFVAERGLKVRRPGAPTEV